MPHAASIIIMPRAGETESRAVLEAGESEQMRKFVHKEAERVAGV
jgi:hypothetical protein